MSVKITVTSSSGRSSFSCEFDKVHKAKYFLNWLRVHGFRAAQQCVQRIGGTAYRFWRNPQPANR